MGPAALRTILRTSLSLAALPLGPVIPGPFLGTPLRLLYPVVLGPLGLNRLSLGPLIYSLLYLCLLLGSFARRCLGLTVLRLLRTRLGLRRLRRHHLYGRRWRRRCQRLDRAHRRLCMSPAVIIAVALGPSLTVLVPLIVLTSGSISAALSLRGALSLYPRILGIVHDDDCLLLFRCTVRLCIRRLCRLCLILFRCFGCLFFHHFFLCRLFLCRFFLFR